MKTVKILSIIALAVIWISCGQSKKQNNSIPGEKKFEVKEVLQATAYTYLKVNEAGEERWVAVTRQEINAGDVFYYDEALPMTNFKSKDLDRTFESIYFINKISSTSLDQNGMAQPQAHTGKTEIPQSSTITMQKAQNEVTIAQIFANKADFSGKEIEIKGVVVKVVEEVMGKNWIHIQDGTNSNGKFDLTITTSGLPKMNDEVTFKGKITIDKDFGYGYSYEVIMEDASLISQNPAGKAI